MISERSYACLGRILFTALSLSLMRSTTAQQTETLLLIGEMGTGNCSLRRLLCLCFGAGFRMGFVGGDSLELGH